MKNHFGKTYIFNKQLMGPTFSTRGCYIFNKGILRLLGKFKLETSKHLKLGNIP
jgi:hypothetical protein